MDASERTVILHYHLFKNAGTSFDGILKQNFPGRWATAEFPHQAGDNSALVADWIQSEPDAVAFSSHTAVGPVPQIPGVRIISALFLRDPVARIRSAYKFEKAQSANELDDRVGVQIARSNDFAGYVRARLAIPGDRQCRDFHVARLSLFVKRMAPELDRAMEALRILSFVGEVERFDRSMARFRKLVAPVWPHFSAGPLHLNQSEEQPVTEEASLAELLAVNNLRDAQLIQRARQTLWID